VFHLKQSPSADYVCSWANLRQGLAEVWRLPLSLLLLLRRARQAPAVRQRSPASARLQGRVNKTQHIHVKNKKEKSSVYHSYGYITNTWYVAHFGFVHGIELGDDRPRDVEHGDDRMHVNLKPKTRECTWVSTIIILTLEISKVQRSVTGANQRKEWYSKEAEAYVP
jgi:hypothetical protein